MADKDLTVTFDYSQAHIVQVNAIELKYQRHPKAGRNTSGGARMYSQKCKTGKTKIPLSSKENRSQEGRHTTYPAEITLATVSTT